MKSIVKFAVALAVVSFVACPVSAEVFEMSIDGSQSELTLAGKFDGFDLTPQGAGADVTNYTGTITVDVDSLLAPTTLAINSASADAEVSGRWLPQVGGLGGTTAPDPSTAADADYGVQILGGVLGYGAFRNLVLDITADSETVDGSGLFDSTESLKTIAGTLDTWIANGSGGTENLNYTFDRDPNNPTQSSYTVSGTTATLEIPVYSIAFDDADNWVSLTGTIRATGTLPEPTTFALWGLAAMAMVFVSRRRRR